MVNTMPYPKSKQPSKYGGKTQVYSIRLLPEVVEKIRKDRIDAGQIIFDVVEHGLNPYLLKRLVDLMVDNKIIAPEGMFTSEEVEQIKKIIGVS